MITIKHRFLSLTINPETEILIIGTFNPETKINKADFFYGRGRNYLWRLLSEVFKINDLKKKSKEEKIDFLRERKIDFIDIISEVQIEEEENYSDAGIDNNVSEWRDIINEIKKLQKIKRVCFTRRTFSDIPNIQKRITEIEEYCNKNKIYFKCLTTPARPPGYFPGTRTEWCDFFNP